MRQRYYKCSLLSLIASSIITAACIKLEVISSSNSLSLSAATPSRVLIVVSILIN
jgi:hypothetical protein